MKRIANICKTWILVGLTAGMLSAPIVSGQMTVIPSGQGKPKLDGTVNLTVHEWGFRPSVLSIRTGRYALVVHNRSLTEDLTIVVTQEGKGNVDLSAEPQRRARDQGYLRVIQPGTYHITVAEHPSWTCTLNVEVK